MADDDEDETIFGKASAVVDPLAKERIHCLKSNYHIIKLAQELDNCNARVTAKEYTAETCHQEVMDLIAAIDHCAAPRAFKRLN